MAINNTILEAVGNTPLVRLNNISNQCQSTILAKVEYYGPTGSIKDRIAKFMLESAEKENKINNDSIILEATTGNTGIALACACAIKGYKMIVVMPEGMSEERRKIIEMYGAEVIFTPGAESDVDITIQKVEEIARENENVFVPRQYSNEDNIRAHELTTGPEIISQVEGTIDALVAAVGTGGTLTGIAKALKEKYPDVKIFAVEPDSCPVISKGQRGPHCIEGIGDGFKPDNLHMDLVDDVITVTDEEALDMTRRIAKEEGLFCGPSSGCNVVACMKVANKIGSGKTIVTVLPDTGQRYFTTELFRKF